MSSNYQLVYKGLDKRDWNRKFRRKVPRHLPITSNLRVCCLKRYFLALGSSQAESITPAHPLGQIISANPTVYYIVLTSKRREFASFTDVVEAFLYCNSLSVYAHCDAFVVQVNR